MCEGTQPHIPHSHSNCHRFLDLHCRFAENAATLPPPPDPSEGRAVEDAENMTTASLRSLLSQLCAGMFTQGDVMLWVAYCFHAFDMIFLYPSRLFS